MGSSDIGEKKYNTVGIIFLIKLRWPKNKNGPYDIGEILIIPVKTRKEEYF